MASTALPIPIPYSGPRRSAGMTLVELAVVVAIIGLLSVVVSAGYSDAAAQSVATTAKADAEAARQAIRAFALRNKRLPCPDLSATGDLAREGHNGTCPSGAQVGWLPYESLGLTRPDRQRRLRYAVGRQDADLVAPPAVASVRTDLDGSIRFRAALAAAARLPASTNRPFLTGPGSSASPEDCGFVQSNPAYALIAPVTDRDGNSPVPTGFDGINVGMAVSNQNCIAAPSRRATADNDDVVVAESASALLGWLAARTR